MDIKHEHDRLVVSAGEVHRKMGQLLELCRTHRKPAVITRSGHPYAAVVPLDLEGGALSALTAIAPPSTAA